LREGAESFGSVEPEHFAFAAYGARTAFNDKEIVRRKMVTFGSAIMAISRQVRLWMLERYSQARMEAKRKAVESISMSGGMIGSATAAL
jgi:hypothetical protein